MAGGASRPRALNAAHGGYLGLAWQWRLTGSLVLKLYPDVALFYGALYLFALLALLGNACAPLRAALSGQPRCVRPVLRRAQLQRARVGEDFFCTTGRRGCGCPSLDVRSNFIV